MAQTKDYNYKSHTFIIDKDILQQLQAIATYKQLTINGILKEALQDYFKQYSDEDIKEALKKYKQIQKLKGIKEV